MFAKTDGILVAMAAILFKLTKNVFVEVQFWPILHIMLFFWSSA
jgi:hypothetical protein